MTTKVLIIDDEELFREDLANLLRRRGYECTTANDANEGLESADALEPDVILCDVVLPGKDGIETLDELSRNHPESFVIMITAFGSLQTAVEAFRRGAADYIMKPLVVEDVVHKIERLISYKVLTREVRFLRRELSRDALDRAVVGQSDAMSQVFDLVGKVAPTRSTVLITGESGTGKELVARAIHQMSQADQEGPEDSVGELPFVPINCSGIPADLLESELFGHVRGAFTGAVKDRVGHFELAGEGTLLLDEVAELPLALQSKLLRVLEEKEFVRVGGSKPIPFTARVIAATNRNLKEFSKSGQFREDLLFRLAVFEIPLPPLRERASDIPLLVEYFIERFNKELKRRCLGVESEAMRKLLSHTWPGNVRELRNVIERAMILTTEVYITLSELPAEFRDIVPSATLFDNLREAMRVYEAEHIERLLDACAWNKEEAARRLGINPSTLYRKMANLEHLMGKTTRSDEP